MDKCWIASRFLSRRPSGGLFCSLILFLICIPVPIYFFLTHIFFFLPILGWKCHQCRHLCHPVYSGFFVKAGPEVSKHFLKGASLMYRTVLPLNIFYYIYLSFGEALVFFICTCPPPPPAYQSINAERAHIGHSCSINHTKCWHTIFVKHA